MKGTRKIFSAKVQFQEDVVVLLLCVICSSRKADSAESELQDRSSLSKLKAGNLSASPVTAVCFRGRCYLALHLESRLQGSQSMESVLFLSVHPTLLSLAQPFAPKHP